MRFDKLVAAAAVAASGVSALPTANPVADANDVAGPVTALTASRSPTDKGENSKGSEKSNSSGSKSKSSKSTGSGRGHHYYKQIRSASPAAGALRRSNGSISRFALRRPSQPDMMTIVRRATRAGRVVSPRIAESPRTAGREEAARSPARHLVTITDET